MVTMYPNRLLAQLQQIPDPRRRQGVTGPMLAWFRNLALTLIRRHDFAYVPDAWSYLSANPDEAMTSPARSQVVVYNCCPFAI